MSLFRKILTSSLWLLVGNSIGRLAMFLANIFAARMLSQEAFGQFAMIKSTISSIEGLISGTLSATTIKEVAETNHMKKENLPYLLSTIFILNIVIALIVAVLIYLNTNYIVEKFLLNNSILIDALYIGIIILLGTTFSTLIQNILMGFEEFKQIAILSIITSIISIPTIFILIYFFQFYGSLMGVAFYYCLDCIIKFIYYKRKQIELNFNSTKFKEKSLKILFFVFPIFLTFLVNGLAFWYVRILVINKTNNFEDIAVFDAAFQWLTIIMIITNATTNVILPKLTKSNLIENENRKIFIIGLGVNIMISFFIAIIFILFSKSIMSIYGNNYVIGYETLNILALTSIVFTISLFLNRYLISKNISGILFISSLAGAAGMYTFVFFNYSILNSKILAESFFIYYIFTILVYIYKIKKGKL